MKSFASIAAAFFAIASFAHAEEAPAPALGLPLLNPPLQSGTNQDVTQPQPLQSSTSDLLVTPTLTPAQPTPKPAETPAQPAAPKPSKKQTAEQLRQAIKIRELKTVALEDPVVQAQKASAGAAKTEEGRRVLMRNYYTLLYAKIEQLDPSLAPDLEQQLHGVLRGYEQHKVRPSCLIEPGVVALPGNSSEDHGSSAGDNDKPKKEPKKSRF